MSNQCPQKYEKSYFNDASEKGSGVLNIYKTFLTDEGFDLSGKEICDVGCARGTFFENLVNKNVCSGYDVSEYAISHCKDKFGSTAHFERLDLNKEALFSEKKFDIITLFDVIEHLDNFVNLKKIIHNNLKPGGSLVVTTPNANSFMRFIADHTKYSGELDSTHTMLFTPYTLDFFLRRCGLSKGCLATPYIFYFKNNLLTQRILFGGQIFAIYKKIL